MSAFGRSARAHRPVRFIIAGGVNTIFGYVVYLFGVSVHLHPAAALAISFAAGAVFNYFTTARFVFGHKALNRLPLFIVVYVLIYAVDAICIKLLMTHAIPPSVAQLVLVPFVATLSFVSLKTFVFHRS